jgi:hypothetical protein
MMKKIKLVLAVMALTASSGAYAMPETVSDGYYSQMWNVVYNILGVHRPCVGQPRTWC